MKNDKRPMPRRREVLKLGALGGAALSAPGAIAATLSQEQAAHALADTASDGAVPLQLPQAVDYAELRRQRLATLDDEMRAIYEDAGKRPNLAQASVAAIRKMVKTPASAVLAKGVRAYNIAIPGPAGDIPTRVYVPEGVQGPLGVYLSTHGGGWVFYEGLDHIDATESRNALDWGCAVVHPDFRVAPEHKFPAAIEDCQAALRYLVRHGAAMGFDTGRIGIGGGCAGANIATVVSLLARDAGEKMPAIQYLWSPVCDTRNMTGSHTEFADGYGLRHAEAEFGNLCYLRTQEDKQDWRTSPLLAPTLSGAPPALIWVGEWEVLRDEARQYAARMRDAGCTVHYLEGAQQGHGFIYQTNLTNGAPTRYSRETVPKINAIMRRYIGPRAGAT